MAVQIGTRLYRATWEINHGFSTAVSDVVLPVFQDGPGVTPRPVVDPARSGPAGTTGIVSLVPLAPLVPSAPPAPGPVSKVQSVAVVPPFANSYQPVTTALGTGGGKCCNGCGGDMAAAGSGGQVSAVQQTEVKAMSCCAQCENEDKRKKVCIGIILFLLFLLLLALKRDRR